MSGVYFCYLNIGRLRFVLNVLVETTKRPRVEALCAGHSISDVGQVLERYVGAVVLLCFAENAIRNTVKHILCPSMLTVAHRLYREMG
jgi:hypothetical protein